MLLDLTLDYGCWLQKSMVIRLANTKGNAKAQ